MSSGDNAAFMMRWFDEVWDQGREETIDALMGVDVFGYHENEEFHGRDDYKRYHRQSLEAMPDLRLTVVNVVAQDNEVVVEWLIRGTHEGEAFGVPPTHKKFEFRGSTWVRIAGGRIVEFRTYWNVLTVLREELEQARSEIEVLKGILPICGHCKKIRNDDGYWEQVENYISKHSLARFSHSLCPACVKEHYAEFMDET